MSKIDTEIELTPLERAWSNLKDEIVKNDNVHFVGCIGQWHEKGKLETHETAPALHGTSHEVVLMFFEIASMAFIQQDSLEKMNVMKKIVDKAIEQGFALAKNTIEKRAESEAGDDDAKSE